MRASAIEYGIPAATALVAAAALIFWARGYLAAPELPDRPLGEVRPHPAPEHTSEPSTAALPPTPSPVPAPPTAFTAPPASAPPPLPGLWPGFRGPSRNNVASGSPALNRDWTKAPPRLLWAVDLGEGYAGPAVRNGRVYLLDHDQAARADTLRCFALADGRELWRQAYPVTVKRNHGMSRTTPAVSERYVVTFGPKCHVLCADAVTGRALWLKDLVSEYDAVVPEWYAGQCPLIDGDRAILATGGKALLIAVELATGKLIWKSPNPRGWQMTHSSIMPLEWNGQKMYVYCGSGGVAGVSAKDGSILWETTEWTIDTATVPSPVPVGEGRIFLTGGYGAGSLMLKLESQAGLITARPLYRLPANEFASEQQTPIYYKGDLYGVVSGGQLVCLGLDGKRRWASGSTHRFGLGPSLIADGLIFALDDSGVLTLAEARPDSFRPLGQIRILDGPEAWGPMALAGTRLLARDLTRMVCVDVGGK